MQRRPIEPSLSACLPTPEVEGHITQSSLKSFPKAIFDADVKRIQLIVNADDFGASEEVNEAVIRAFQTAVVPRAVVDAVPLA